jgi:hypothetical protein
MQQVASYQFSASLALTGVVLQRYYSTGVRWVSSALAVIFRGHRWRAPQKSTASGHHFFRRAAARVL